MRKTLIPACVLLSVVLLLLGCSLFGSTDFLHRKYHAVKLESGDGWSIIDEEGNVVVDDEFDGTDELSDIWGDTYWVKSDGKFMLYSVKDSRKPISDVEYNHVSEMYKGRALVARAGQPIKIINEKGDVVATLPTDIVEVVFNFSPFCSFMKSDKTYGWMDMDGHIIKEGFFFVACGLDRVAVAQQKEDGPFLIFDAKGQETGRFKADAIHRVSSDAILAKVKDQFVLFDNSGKQLCKFKRSIENMDSFVDGYATFFVSSDKCGIVNDKGEEELRAKYVWLANLGGGCFLACKNSKFGVIDHEGKELIDIDYDAIIKLGDNFLVKEDEVWLLLNDSGEELLGDIAAVNTVSCAEYRIRFFDMSAIAGDVAKLANLFDPSLTVALLATRLSIEPTSDLRYHSMITQQETMGDHQANVSYHFDGSVVKELTHQEIRGEFFRWTETVIDGYDWSDAPLDVITIKLDISGEMDYDDAELLMKQALSKLDYKLNEDGDMFATVNGKKRHISFTRGTLGELVMTISK